MITFFTALVFSYTIQEEQVTIRIWLNSYQECLDAMTHTESLYDFMADNVSDHNIFMLCETTTVKSKELVKPRPRPHDL